MREDYIADQAEARYFDLLDRLSDLSYQYSDSLLPISTQLDLPVQTSAWLVQGQTDSPLLTYAPVRDVAFSDALVREQVNSDLLDIGEQHVILVRVRDYQPQRDKTLDESRAAIRAELIEQEQEQRVSQLVANTLQQLRDGATLEQVSQQMQLELSAENATVSRDDSTQPRRVVASVFSMPKPLIKPTYDSVRLAPSRYSILQLTEVKQPQLDEVSVDNTTLWRQQTQTEYYAWIESVQAETEIDVNETLVENINLTPVN